MELEVNDSQLHTLHHSDVFNGKGNPEGINSSDGFHGLQETRYIWIRLRCLLVSHTEPYSCSGSLTSINTESKLFGT